MLNHWLKRSYLSLTNYKDEYFSIKNTIGINPGNIKLYKTALKHKSTVRNSFLPAYNNERLEFLGDAVLDMAITDIMFNDHPEMDEGTLTRIRSELVKRKTMNKIASKMGIKDLLIVDKNTAQASDKIYGNALEAIIGAVYLDKGYRRCKKFVSEKYLSFFDMKTLTEADYDPKSELYHVIQDNKWNIDFLSYENIEECENLPHFISFIKVNNKFISEGKGWSKKEAEQSASKIALEKITS